MLIGRSDNVVEVSLEMCWLGMQFTSVLDEVGQIDCSLREDLSEVFALLLYTESQLSNKVEFVKGYLKLMLLDYSSEKSAEVSNREEQLFLLEEDLFELAEGEVAATKRRLRDDESECIHAYFFLATGKEEGNFDCLL